MEKKYTENERMQRKHNKMPRSLYMRTFLRPEREKFLVSSHDLRIHKVRFTQFLLQRHFEFEYILPILEHQETKLLMAVHILSNCKHNFIHFTSYVGIWIKSKTLSGLTTNCGGSYFVSGCRQRCLRPLLNVTSPKTTASTTRHKNLLKLSN